MRIAIGCDHIVTKIKNEVAANLVKKGHEVIDCGTYDDVRTHYPIYGFEVARQVVTKKADLGVVICGTGVGISNSANKVKGARCFLTRDVATAVAARKEYGANIIGMGGRISGIGLIEEMVDAFIRTKPALTEEDFKNVQRVDDVIKNDNYDTTQFDQLIQDWKDSKYTTVPAGECLSIPKQWKK